MAEKPPAELQADGEGAWGDVLGRRVPVWGCSYTMGTSLLDWWGGGAGDLRREEGGELFISLDALSGDGQKDAWVCDCPGTQGLGE